MEFLIKSQNFVHNDDKVENSFRNTFSELTEDDTKIGVEDVVKCLQSLGDKLTADTKPEPETKGWEMAHWTFKKVLYMARNLSGNSQSKEIGRGFYLFVVRLLDNGLTILHILIAYESLYEGDIQVKEYIQSFEKANLTSLLSVVCKPVKSEETVGSNYANNYYKWMNELLKNTLTTSQVKEVFTVLLDYAVYCYLDSINLPEEIYRKITDTGQMVFSVLDNPFSSFDDVEKMKAYIRRCTHLFQSPAYAPNKTVSRYALDFMERKMMKELGKQGKLDEIYNEIFDLLMAISKCTYTLEGEKYLFELFYGAQVYFSNYETKSAPKNASAFENIVKRFIKVVEEMDMKFLNHYRFAYSVVDNALKKLYANDKQKSNSWVSMLVPLLRRPCESTVRASYTITSENKAIKWKEHKDIVDQVLENFQSFQPPSSTKGMERKQKDEIKEYLDYFKRTAEYFFEGLKKDKITKLYGKKMMNLTLKFLDTDHEELYNLAESIAEKTELNPKEDKNVMIEAVKKFYKVLQNEDLPWTTKWSLYRAANDFIDSATEPFKDGKVFANEDFDVFVSICLECLKYDCINQETGSFPSGYFSIFLTVVNPLFKWLEALNKMDIASPLIPEFLKCLDVDDENVVTLVGVYFMTFGRVKSGQQVVAPYLEKLITAYLEKENQNLLMAITEIYPSNPKALKSHFRDLIQQMEDSGDPTLIMYLTQLFQNVSKKQAELFTSKDIEMLFTKAKEYPNAQVLILQMLQELCKRCPDRVIDHLQVLFDKSAWSPHMQYFLNDMMVTLALYKKEVSSVVLAELFKNLNSSQDKTFLLVTFNSIRIIGFKYPEMLKQRRNEVELLSATDPDVINQKKIILDMIDGKTPEDMVKQMKKQEEELASLVGRVDETEEVLNEVKIEVNKQEEKLDNVQNEMNEQGKILINIESKVDETFIKVEEIDKKTLSHAPYWARDLSKLLNPKSEHDWRLLSSRLGYNNADIRGWAQQADPCMALLNEWYITHKTSEATLAILTQLQEMDRLDAAVIVENAMKNSESIVEDEEFVYASTPQIFISYQWYHQTEVKLLKQHLEMAGYECWLDIGQMGGGDKLFEKIDTGIRAAKVVISCVTSKYAKSPNCNREVNLAVSLNKPIIPLLLEQCPWPPPGSMGPIFSEYLFIRFFQRTGEDMPDQRYWAKDKFQELLMQLNVNGLAPDESKVQPEYKNWWLPVIYEIEIDESKTKNGGTVTDSVQSDLDKIASEAPDIFISYQWAKQKNIIKLYERLTSFGYSCWLDIKQMGGGDSLYDKIDKGIRGCKVVLSCVTQKYSLSANCRREVSLTDALKKPMIPLLLEDMTWPPSGPMSMVMTQLLYINFSKDESSQISWDGPKFIELLNQIQLYFPKKRLSSADNSIKTSQMKVSDNKMKVCSNTVLTKATQNILNSNSSTQKLKPKISNTTMPSLAPIKQQSKSNTMQLTTSSSPSSVSYQSRADPIKKPDIAKTIPLTKSTPPSITNILAKQTQNKTTNLVNIAPSSKQLLKPISSGPTKPISSGPTKPISSGPTKPISSDPATSAVSASKISASNTPTRTLQSKTNTQKLPARPSRLPPLEQQNDRKKSPRQK